MSQAAAHLHWQSGAGLDRAEFFAEGMHCANCARSIRTRVGALPGVQSVDVNLTSTRVSVSWNPAQLRLAGVLGAIEALGFKPVPLSGAAADTARRAERRSMLKRIGLAGLAAMQMSMYTVGLYAGALTGIEPWLARLLRVTSMLLAVPVMFYSGWPFLLGAWHDLRRRALGMDVPVAAALLLAFTASVVNTLRDSGQVYFDSVAMFIFFLLVGRFVEMNVRRGSLDAGEALARTLPAKVTRLKADGGSEKVLLAELAAGDRILVAHGAVVPVDAVLAEGSTLVDESLITGESVPVTRTAGHVLPGGALNLGGPCQLVATRDVRSSTLASMVGLIERAQAERPPQALAADRYASQFVLWIVLLSLVVAGAWLWINPARAFEAVLAVLVVTCPCALSLATPVALAAATTRLARRGVLVTRAHALEGLAGVDTVVLDKTGTLTSARMQLGDTRLHGGLDQARCLALAASLEQHSTHPLASAFTEATTARLTFGSVREFTGQGLEGACEGTIWRIGQHAFVAALAAPATAAATAVAAADDDHLWLGSAAGMAADFELIDTLRPDALAGVAKLRALGLEVRIASGDRTATVQRVATALGIGDARGRMTPDGKQALIRELQAGGRKVLMVGDGINDGPVLAAANVSAAMGGGAAIAHAAADLLLMNESLGSVAAAVDTGRGTARLVRANLRWALGYNLCAVPLAAVGLVPPWLAAVGMSCSSLYVVWRARRFAGTP
jgi:P-type Cu2+ transporter